MALGFPSPIPRSNHKKRSEVTGSQASRNPVFKPLGRKWGEGRSVWLKKIIEYQKRVSSQFQTELVPLTKKYSTVHLTLTFSCWPESSQCNIQDLGAGSLDANWRWFLRAPPLSLNTQSSDTLAALRLVPHNVRRTACPIHTHQQGRLVYSAPEN